VDELGSELHLLPRDDCAQSSQILERTKKLEKYINLKMQSTCEMNTALLNRHFLAEFHFSNPDEGSAVIT
jgi:hypothetical protein